MNEAFDPISLPLWATFLFAVSMYPLGFMLHGCQCCQQGCIQCGSARLGYVDGQNSGGRMCCTDAPVSSITLRITNVGPSSTTQVVRAYPPSGSQTQYLKSTFTFPCAERAGDYVLWFSEYLYDPDINLSMDIRRCTWLDLRGNPGSGDVTDLSLWHVSGGDFPLWRLQVRVSLQWPYSPFGITVRNQTCTYDSELGSEACTVGTVGAASGCLGQAVRYRLDDLAEDQPDATMLGDVQSIQKCNPAGAFYRASQPLLASSVGSGRDYTVINGYAVVACFRGDTGCRWKVEIV